MQARIGAHRFSDVLEEMDFGVVHGYLAGSYWSEGISATRMRRAMEHSLNFGAFAEDGRQVAYARVVTDRATFAYLCDVFVLESERGQGISKRLMKFVLAHPDLQGIRRFNLATRDAHGLYARFGWTELEDPGRYMEINKPGLYKTLRDEEPRA